MTSRDGMNIKSNARVMSDVQFARQLCSASYSGLRKSQYSPLEYAMLMARRRNQKSGFTLVETVVTVGIIATLAAVVYPSVVKQFDSADPARIINDLTNIRTGIEAFGLNVRPHLPRKMFSLTTRVTTSDTDIVANAASYSVADVNSWQGPYVALSIPVGTALDSAVFTTAYGATVLNRLPLYQIDKNATGGDTVPQSSVASAHMVAIHIKGLSGVAFNAINNLIDGPSENTAVLRRFNGRFRCPGGAPLDTDPCADAYFLAVPLR